jgi:hypothetical protein
LINGGFTAANPGFTAVTSAAAGEVVNNGAIVGSVILPTGVSTVLNNPGATLSAPRVDLGGAGTLTNAGNFDIGGRGVVGETSVHGNFVQTATGTLVIDADFAKSNADRLDVGGKATLAGSIQVNALSPLNRPVTILTAGDGLTIDPSVNLERGALVSYDVQLENGAVLLQPRADFVLLTLGFSATEQSVAAISKCLE